MTATRNENISVARKVKRALTGMSRNDFLWLDPLLDVSVGSDTEYRMSFRGIEFTVRFDKDGENATVDSDCSYIDGNGIRKHISIPDKECRCYPENDTQFGTKGYRYSIADLESTFCHEPFVLKHLTRLDLTRYAAAVKFEMMDWDRWLRQKQVTRDKYDSHRCDIEERILNNFAPYLSDVGKMDDYLELFLITKK